MGIIAWIIFGALAGWLATLVAGEDQRFGGLANIGIGIVGAIIGGFIASLLGFWGVTGFNLASLLIAILGALLFLFVIGSFHTHQTR
jgi:uncharacterized membrane protein YeaQ/YmgE (transglycosylase-associated protein family)